MALHGEDSLPQKGDVVEPGRDPLRAAPRVGAEQGACPLLRRLAHRQPGGAWLPCGGGGDKAYSGGVGGEAVAYRRKYEFRAAEEADRGEMAMPERTRWRMKQYRLNDGAAAFHRAYAHSHPKANMDCVVREIYTKAVSPPTPPSVHSSDEEGQEGSGYSVMDEDFEDEDDYEFVDHELRDFEDDDSDEDQPRAAE